MLQDQKAREQICQELDSNFWVEAGAGTGKTTLLVDRIVALIAQRKIPLSRLLAITFTHKAADELLGRVQGKLQSSIDVTSSSAGDGHFITTIHGFCAWVLRQYAFLLGIDAHFDILQGPAKAQYLKRLFSTWVRSHANKDELALVLRKNIGLEQIQSLALDLFEKRENLESVRFTSSSLNLEKSFANIHQRLQSLRKNADLECVDHSDAMYQAICQSFAICQSAKKDVLDASPQALARHLENMFLYRLQGVCKPGRTAQKRWQNKELHKAVKAEVGNLQTEIAAVCDQLRKQSCQKVFGLLLQFFAFAEEQKIRDAKLDFHDLLLLCRHLLRKHKQVRSELYARFDAILVDEFQDTDPLQAEIVWMLSQKGNGPWQEEALHPGKLFVVGDPKQSIYRFRGADINTYLSLEERFLRFGTKAHIQQNFRSGGDVIAWVNAIFTPMMAEHYMPLLSNQTQEHAKGKVALLQAFDSPEPLPARHALALESDSIAHYVRHLLNSKTSVFDKTLGKQRPIAASDIAILFPTSAAVDPLEEALRKKGLPFVLEGGSAFYARREINGLCGLLAALLYPQNPRYVVWGLRSIFIGASDQDLLTIKQEEGQFDYRTFSSAALPPHIKRAAEILHKLHKTAFGQSSTDVLHSLLEAFWAFPIVLDGFHGEQSAANIEKLCAMAREFDENQGHNPAAFFAHFLRHTQERIFETEALSKDAGADHIYLSTIHKSKGLEFPIVILFLSTGANKQSQRVYADQISQRMAFAWGPKGKRFASDMYEDLRLAEEAKQEDECKRLLYVAATRAKQQLIIVQPCKRKRSPSMYWTLLQSHLQEQAKHMNVIEVDKLPAKELVKTRKNNSTTTPISKLATWAKSQEKMLTSLLANKVERSKGSKHFTPSWNSLYNRGFGLAYHQCIELAVKTMQSPVGFVAGACKRFGVLGRLDEMQELLIRTEKSTTWQRIWQGQQVQSEIPFRMQKDKTSERGLVDLAFVENGAWVIVDMKTDTMKKGSEASMRTKYQEQLMRYVSALEGYQGYPVKEALLYMVRSDSCIEVFAADSSATEKPLGL